MMQYDDPYYEEAEADFYGDDDCCPPKEEPDCGGCNDRGWVKPYGVLRRVLARVLPLCVVWWQWRGLLYPMGTLGGSWPCSGCNPCWIDTWLPSRLMDRLRWRRYRRRMRRAGADFFDDEPPF